MSAADVIDSFRKHAHDPARNGENRPTQLPTLSVIDRSVSLLFSVTREDAAEFFETSLFTGGVCVISASGRDRDRTPVPVDVAEFMATMHKLLGEDVPMKLRHISFGPTLGIYFLLLSDGQRFVAPTPMQDVFLARRYDASALVPAVL